MWKPNSLMDIALTVQSHRQYCQLQVFPCLHLQRRQETRHHPGLFAISA